MVLRAPVIFATQSLLGAYTILSSNTTSHLLDTNTHTHYVCLSLSFSVLAKTKAKNISTMSTEQTNTTTTDAITDLEPRKMNDTFDTEAEDDSDSQEQEEVDEEEDYDGEYEVQDAAMDLINQLVELFVEKNGREPNQEEVMQWIDVFKSMKIEDGGEAPEAADEGEETAAAAAE